MWKVWQLWHRNAMNIEWKASCLLLLLWLLWLLLVGVDVNVSWLAACFNKEHSLKINGFIVCCSICTNAPKNLQRKPPLTTTTPLGSAEGPLFFFTVPQRIPTFLPPEEDVWIWTIETQFVLLSLLATVRTLNWCCNCNNSKTSRNKISILFAQAKWYLKFLKDYLKH